MNIEVASVQAEEDFRRLYELFAEYEAWLPQDLRHGSVPDVDDLKAAYAGRNAAFLATHDGRAIGCVAVMARDRETALLRHLFVTPQSRGLGAARSLVTRAIAFVRESGFLRIALDTEKERLKPAYRLYRSLGFEECRPHGEVEYGSPTFMELLL